MLKLASKELKSIPSQHAGSVTCITLRTLIGAVD